MSGSAKISGTLISLGGAMMLTFYKGSALTHTTSSINPASSSGHRQAGGEHGTVRWLLGSISMLANVVGFALWLMLQRKFTSKYPAVYSATALMSLFSFIQAGALALSIEDQHCSLGSQGDNRDRHCCVLCKIVLNYSCRHAPCTFMCCVVVD